MLGTLQAKLIGGGLAVLALLYMVHVFHDRAELRTWQKTVLVATQTASDNPKLIVRDVPKQIALMGNALDEFRTKITVQNKAVDQLGSDRDKAFAEAARQAALRKEVIRQSQSLAQQLRNSALTPVERGRLEAELRKVQDMAWEAGL